MVVHTCNICLKQFGKKSHYVQHVENKKKPCKPIDSKMTPNDSEFAPKSLKMTPNDSKMTPNDSKITQKSQENCNINLEKNKNICVHCLKTFSKNSNLYRHLNENRCKVKMLEEEKKQNILESLIEKDKKIDVIINKFEKMEENNKNLIDSLKTQNEELKMKNEELENKINKILNKNTEKITNNTNNSNNTQNITNNNIFVPYKINAFNEETFKKLDKKEVLKIMTDTDNNGSFCFNKLIKMIHFNNKVPENQNIYMNDYNRGLYMIHDGNQWNLRKDEEFIIFSVLEHVRDLFNEYNDEEFEEKLEKDINFNKNFQTTFKKYFDYVYDEVEDKDLDEKELKKKKEFKLKMDKEVKNGLYNFRHIPQKSFELLENLLQN